MTRPPATLIAASHLSDDDRDILAGISVMVLAIANRQNLAEQAQQALDLEDETEGMEPAPCGMQNPDDPDRYCIGEPGHSGRHEYCTVNGLVN